ncbi:MAG TPA: outer membrane protein assembly factor BamA [Nitrospirota bacterium]|nr:outer membrane protein assembly factor BamA [Nitrospirota bacterium]
MHRQHVAAIVALVFTVFCVVTPPVAAADVKVTLIEVQGNKRIETATILAKIKTREGGIFSPSQIKEDIKILYQLGHFEDVQVKTEGFEQGLKVIFLVKEKPLLREIEFAGNSELSTEKLKEGMTLSPRAAFNLQLINEQAEKIRLKYQDAGFYSAVVIPVITEQRSDRNVLFYIEEGSKVRLIDIVFAGNKVLTDEQLRKPLKSQEEWLFTVFDRSGTLRTEELREDLETIRNLYFNRGYIQVQVDEPVITPKQHTFRECYFWGPPMTFTRKNELVIHINIKEGEQFRVGSIAIKGNKIIETAELEKLVKLKKGDIFNRDQLRQDVNSIIDRYDSIARPFANVSPLFDIDQEKRTVALTVDIQEGGEVRIGRINIIGNNKTRDKVIRREMRLDEGDLYSKQALKRSYERINNLNFFENVEIIPERRRTEPIMDLNVKVKEKMTGTLSVGGGYSSVDKLVGIAEITQGNLGGRGQLLKFKTQVGGTGRQFVLSFMEPYLFDEPVWGRIDLYNQTQRYDGYDLKTTGMALSTGKSFGEYVSTSLRYSLDQSELYNIAFTAPDAVTNQVDIYGKTILSSALAWNLGRDSRDFYLDPKRGSRNNIFVQYTGGPLKGDTNFVKTIEDSAWYMPLVLDTVFMVRGRFGYVESLNDKPVPLSDRFYVGGQGTVRGFRYGTVGPTRPSSTTQYNIAGPVNPVNPATGDLQPVSQAITGQNAIGATKEVVFNAEFSFPIIPAARLKGVLFYDLGKGFDQYETVKFSALRQSWGWGFWWMSPLGPLKFEWGYIIHRKPEDSASEFDFSIGALF